MLGSKPQTVRFVYAIFETETELANEHKRAITNALKKHKQSKKWQIGPDMFAGKNLNLSEAMLEISREINGSCHYIFLSDGEPLNQGMQRMLRSWPANTSRAMVVFINDEALAGNGGNSTRLQLCRMAEAGAALGAVAARDANRAQLQPQDLETIIKHLLKK